ncbi:uncharacterized protein LOC115086185 [Rhinatrema bivittatum]|uniref:uncharacterized protein LOC115086185 n=1 Tax=Rhinatrema bivittatum TaxID=194408 RepID=UPI00112BBF84|nr:uncharacterized protein LOC115086185 [Rhinatrema bivittatum]
MLHAAVIWFLRLYMHYCTQWLFLHAISVPVSKFQLFPHTVDLCYQNSLLHTREELAMVLIGPLALNAVMLLMVLSRWGYQLMFDSYPPLLSKFIIALGLWTVLDPLAIFLMDAFLGRLSYSADNPIADAAKLYWLFYRTQQSGIPGILITMLLYTVITIISFSTLYVYLLRLHAESWVMDVFQRIHSEEDKFYVPYDLEISNQELSYIVRKAEQWRGINGERRKVAVYDYVWRKDNFNRSVVTSSHHQHQDDAPQAAENTGDVTIHVSIYTVHLSGFQELYRHFLRLPDGAIIEVFGDINGINPLHNDISTAVEDHVNEMDKMQQLSSVSEFRERKKNAAR